MTFAKAGLKWNYLCFVPGWVSTYFFICVDVHCIIVKSLWNFHHLPAFTRGIVAGCSRFQRSVICRHQPCTFTFILTNRVSLLYETITNTACHQCNVSLFRVRVHYQRSRRSKVRAYTTRLPGSLANPSPLNSLLTSMMCEIYYYNFKWKDYGFANTNFILDIVKVISFALTQGKIAIHCHADKKLIDSLCERAHKRVLLKLIKCGEFWKKKRRLIVQNGGTFLTLLLAPLISGVLGSLFNKRYHSNSILLSWYSVAPRFFSSLRYLNTEDAFPQLGSGKPGVPPSHSILTDSNVLA
uniref:Uncharacterized protein n=1 Tax=Timema monikensis TaxID=170555 RepID=A0A7R9EC53_9NEOP|nr:unnamed protein product [Timema monikensis]